MTQTISLGQLRLELDNYLSHGRPHHKGDWFHEWARYKNGTLAVQHGAVYP